MKVNDRTSNGFSARCTKQHQPGKKNNTKLKLKGKPLGESLAKNG